MSLQNFFVFRAEGKRGDVAPFVASESLSNHLQAKEIRMAFAVLVSCRARTQPHRRLLSYGETRPLQQVILTQ